MFERFRGREQSGGGVTTPGRTGETGETTEGRPMERMPRGEGGAPAGERTEVRPGEHAHDHHTHDHDRDHDHGRGGAGAAAAGAAAGTRDVRARQRDEFGGFNLGSAFFGWLVATGLAVILTAIAAAAGAAIGLSQNAEVGGGAGSIGPLDIVGAIVVLAVLFLAYYCGGYVAGRMSRFDGARQGFGVWAFGIIITLLLAAAGAIFGAEYNVLQQLNLPRVPIDEGELATGGLIALAAWLLATLLGAIAGGKVGERYHKKVDRVGGLTTK